MDRQTPPDPQADALRELGSGVRLVSMMPSATEIVYALGLGNDLVGVIFECDEPAARAEKAIIPVAGTPPG